MAENRRTCLVITSYHADDQMIDLTRECLYSLRYDRPDHVILIDDHSPLAIPLKTWSKQVDKLIVRHENGGFPKCANTGFKEAAKTDADIFILSNNDITYTPGWVAAIVKPIELGYDISSILVSDSDGYVTEDKIERDGRFGSLWAMTRQVYETLGGFDERFGAGTHEDLDFRTRAKEHGFRIAKNHAAMVEHVGRATMNKLYPKQEDYWQGRQTYIEKWGKIE